MKKNSLILFLSLTLSLVGCSTSSGDSKSTSKKKDASQKETTLNVNSSYVDLENGASKEYTFKFTYTNSLFNNAANRFNKDLALLSYGLAVSNQDKETMGKFYSDLGFTNVEYAREYDEDPKVNEVGYTFATKEVNNYNLVAVSVRGFNYGKQWLDNFDLGEEGDHVGLSQKSTDVHNYLNQYVSNIENNKPIKLWMSGYSRGGAIVNGLAGKILSSPLTTINKDNIYVYTFEAPRILSQEHASKYDNVFNIINSADLVTKLAPEEYGLYRCGIDVEIYSKDFDKNIKAYDKDAVIPEFKASLLYKDDAGLADYVMKCLLTDNKPEEGERNWSAATRELYNENYGEDISYLVNLIALSEGVSIEDITSLMENMSTAELIALLTGSSASLIAYIENMLDELEVSYDPEQLEKVFNDLYNFFQQPSVTLLLGAFTSVDTLVRLVDMHMPDTTYMLLNALKIL